MEFTIKCARLVGLLVPALALATPASAQVRSTLLSDSQEPGSVIVFPKFINAPAVTLPESTPGTTPPVIVTAPVTELEIGVVCPKGDTCAEDQPVKIRFHWVCGSTEASQAGSFVCPEIDFDVTATVWEKIVLVPDGTAEDGYVPGLPTKTVPAAPCNAGFLIGWVIDPANDGPVKFDGLIGDAHLRPGSPATSTGSPAPIGSPTALAGYDAIPIQADPALPTFPAAGSAVTTNANGALLFDGAPGDYLAVSGQVLGDVRYTNLTTGPTLTQGVLTLLTLDVKSNRPNNPVFVDLDFFGGNPSAIGNENQLSTSTEFICWGEILVDSIDSNLTTAFMGREGVFASAPAEKVQIFGVTDESGPTTLLGLSEVLEGGTTTPWPRASFSGLFNSSNPISSRFLPASSPILP
jgi:hypothetical protein